MLDELLLFYDKNDIFDQDDIEMLRRVQFNRNCIHAYMDRNIGTWSDLQYTVRFFIYLLEKLMNSYPDLDDMRTAEAEANRYY
ncbi:MAG: hypothetical protein GX800_01700 [Clostridiaceae bacterium]|nr:hypothetical protein [Clostridiaceae bacterium]